MKIVLILCDALRADRVSPKVMPNLFKLAENSVYYPLFFGNGGTTAWSLPHFLCGQKDYDPENTFPGKLTEAGIHNSLIHSNAVLNAQEYEKCFKEYLDTGVEMDPIKTGLRNRFRKTELWTKTRALRKAFMGNKAISLPYRRASTILNYAQQNIDTHKSGFWWVHLMDPHIPYTPPGLNKIEQDKANILYEKVLKNIQGKCRINAQETKELFELYDKECTYMDTQIIQFIDANPDCLFLITSDHGEMFNETHSFSHGPYYHGMTMQLGHIPFIVYKKGITPKIVFDYHNSVDIAPTILDLFGLPSRFGYGRSVKEDIQL